MLRYMAGVVSALLLVAAGFFVWKSQAEQENLVPPAPQAVMAAPTDSKVEEPPRATEKSKEEKRFARADKDDDGRITLEELYQPRRKAFAKLDRNGDGRLVFEEWAISTGEKFSGADSDRSGWLSPKEYETTRPKVKAKPKRCAC
ncbi:MAG TPA: EF-hand domain-containing protein [Allosphingosinicella sp.]